MRAVSVAKFFFLTGYDTKIFFISEKFFPRAVRCEFFVVTSLVMSLGHTRDVTSDVLVSAPCSCRHRVRDPKFNFGIPVATAKSCLRNFWYHTRSPDRPGIRDPGIPGSGPGTRFPGPQKYPPVRPPVWGSETGPRRTPQNTPPADPPVGGCPGGVFRGPGRTPKNTPQDPQNTPPWAGVRGGGKNAHFGHFGPKWPFWPKMAKMAQNGHFGPRNPEKCKIWLS